MKNKEPKKPSVIEPDQACPYCGALVTGMHDGHDETLDYCQECDKIVEGHTVPFDGEGE